jgi:CRP/FNR family cyclic AMP-dependent transcriptional regulator
MLAVAQLPRVDTRLLIAMWHLSERWGTVRPEGRVLPGFLSHELLGWIVGARRPSVTTALGQLSQKGLVKRQPDGTWLLGDEPPVFEGLAVAS